MHKSGHFICAVLSVLVVLLGISSSAIAQQHDLRKLSVSAQANTSGTPMLGVDYSVTDDARVRFALGYFQADDRYSPCQTADLPPNMSCDLVLYHAKTHQVSSSIAGLYDLIDWSDGSVYTGAELHHSYAWAPDRSDRSAAALVEFRDDGSRTSISGLVGLSIHLDSWLTLFGEMGLGYARGIAVNSFEADLDSDTRRWGVTHFNPGIRISL